jgi:hypothetical protein
VYQPRHFAVGIEIEASGHVTSARIDAPGDRELDLRACLEQSLLAARLPCSPDGKSATARFLLTLEAYQPGKE